MRNLGSPHGNCLEASIRWTSVARVAFSLRANSGHLASSGLYLSVQPATNQRAQRRDRTNV
jgi:hypothetical protein